MEQTLTNLSILGRKLSIKLISPKALDRITEDTDCLGYYSNQTIYLNNSLKGDELKRVFIHELSHALFEITGLSLILGETKEDAVCTVNEIFLDLFRDRKIAKILGVTNK